jgi:hypothetical protein
MGLVSGMPKLYQSKLFPMLEWNPATFFEPIPLPADAGARYAPGISQR